MSYKKTNGYSLGWIIVGALIVSLLGFCLMGCQQMSPITEGETTNTVTNPVQHAITHAMGHMTNGPYNPSNQLSATMTPESVSDISKMHFTYVITNVSSNTGYLWFEMTNTQVDIIVMRDQAEIDVNVGLLSSANNPVNSMTNGVVSNFDYQIFSVSNGAWYLNINSANVVTNLKIVRVNLVNSY